MKLVYPDVHGNGGWADYTVLAEGSFTQAEDIFMDNFGLELDYLIHIM